MTVISSCSLSRVPCGDNTPKGTGTGQSSDPVSIFLVNPNTRTETKPSKPSPSQNKEEDANTLERPMVQDDRGDIFIPEDEVPL